MDLRRECNTDEEIAQMADDRLMDALLMHVGDADAGRELEDSIERLMSRVDRHETIKSRWNRMSAVWTRVLAPAAAALVIIGLFLLTQISTPALAGVNEIIQALRSPGDRTYIITVVNEIPPQPGKRQAVELLQPLNRPGLDGATLYLRDGKSYLLNRTGPNGHAVLDGFDGINYWRIRKGELVAENEDPLTSKLPMPEVMAGIPFGDLASAIENMAEDYEFSDVKMDERKGSGTDLCYLNARSKSKEVKGPSSVEIWADPETGIPLEIVFHDAKFQGNRDPQSLILTLKDQLPLPLNWFFPSAHSRF